jgi:hypothetical protein
MGTDQLIQDSAYVVLFDVSRQGFQAWREASLPAIVTIVALVLALITKKASSDQRNRRLLVYNRALQVAMILGIIGTVGSLVYTWREFQQLSGALTSGQYRSMTGAVTDLVPERPDGHPRESFRVNSVGFEYSSSDVTSAFHRTVGSGGPLREGLRVRVADVDGKIVRLETINQR